MVGELPLIALNSQWTYSARVTAKFLLQRIIVRTWGLGLPARPIHGQASEIPASGRKVGGGHRWTKVFAETVPKATGPLSLV